MSSENMAFEQLRFKAYEVVTIWKKESTINEADLQLRLDEANQIINELTPQRHSFLTDDERLLKALRIKGESSLFLEHYQDAISCLRQCLALESTPEKAAVHAKQLGIAYVAVGFPKRACQYFELSVDLMEGNEEGIDEKVRQLWHYCCGM
ncbi:hypothetical protein GCM10023331_03510 [Algivirga pacifica]|uniref:Tetratricopeptide repeat protein n=2 Tax=Algivirga pacifica TaxID=1162670 RepID=A0ABP9D223_9BACT